MLTNGEFFTIDSYGMTDRMRRLKDALNDAAPSICVERARLFTESCRMSDGESVCVKNAKAFRHVCRNIPVTIFDDELVVGVTGRFRRSAVVCPELSWIWVEHEMDSFPDRKQDPYAIGDEQKRVLREDVFPYWKGKSLEEAFLARVPEDTASILVDTGIVDNDSKWRNAVGEITPDYQDVLFKEGFIGLHKKAKAKLEELEPVDGASIDAIDFYTSIMETSAGIVELARRYSDKAAEMAESEHNESRRAELLEISATCARVPAEPPRSFREAVQFVWFTQMGSILAENSLALNIGRFDQFMYPFYENDIESGIMTRGEAQELVECLWIKFSEWVWAISKNTANYFAGYNSFQNLTVGGRKRDGSCGVNELSYLCLRATADVRTHQPGLSVRIHPDTPQEFLNEVLKLVRLGTGFPAIHNDGVGSAMLLAAGLSPEDARDWSNCGCVVPHFRKVGEWTSAVNVNMAAALEYAMNDGKSRLTGMQMGLNTGAPEDFSSIDDLYEAYEAQLKNLIKHAKLGNLLAQKIHSEKVPRPYISLLVDGPLEGGVDLSNGGAFYRVGSVLTGIGLADAANSIAAVERLVFDEKKVSMSDLIKAMNSDWEGFDSIQKMALACPKYGNDDEFVDRYAVRISDLYSREVASTDDFWNVHYNSAFMGISNYVPMGFPVGATPDGRRAGSPLTEGCSPHAGTDVTSPTATMRSIAKLNHVGHSGGTLLNMKFNPDALKSDRDLNRLGDMVRAYFELGAFHVQFNVISADTLRDAQLHPENYRDLLVRVAGYSTRFVVLSKEMQDAIIARNTYVNV